MTLAGLNTAWAEPTFNGPGFTAVPGAISGVSPDGLGTWTVHYERVGGGDAAVADAINNRIDAEANRQVEDTTWNGSTKRPWTFDAAGTVHVRPMTVAEVFTGRYGTDEPHMPMDSTATVVSDSRSGVVITWDNLFRDKTAGLTRLGDESASILAAAAPPTDVRAWRRMGQFAPIDVNFKAWIPTAKGIELHFPEFQFGRGLKVVTVAWPKVKDLLAPEFISLIE